MDTVNTSSNRIDRFLKLLNDRGGSDLHLSVGRPPLLRLHGDIEPIRYGTLTDPDFAELLKPVLGDEGWDRFLVSGDTDLAYEVPGMARFRVNVFKQYRGMGAVFRLIPTRLMTLEQLGMPRSVERFCYLRQGLMLVTGPTGSGKSTTLSAILDRINEEQQLHIITIEDPIEFVHPNKKSIISQREIGAHATQFSEALKAAVREDPDLILVGELRDLETIRTAIQAAESGLTVFATLHTNSAAKAVDRILNVFPEEEQEAVRGALAESLRGVLAQQLVKKKAGGRVAALEVLFATSSLGTLIREGKTAQVQSVIAMGKTLGMVTMDDSLWNLVGDDVIEPLAAYEKAIDKTAFRDRLASINISVEG
jgi:twitching motility protein PilT